MILLVTFCALRCGEVLELRLNDIDLNNNCLSIKRAVVFIRGKAVVSVPKTLSSIRNVYIPPHIIKEIKKYISTIKDRTQNSLLFVSRNKTHIGKKTLIYHFKKACKVAGRCDLRFHDLRHTGAVLAALSGATIKELMERLGHSTPQMAIRYQHVANGRSRQIAQNISAYAMKQIK